MPHSASYDHTGNQGCPELLSGHCRVLKMGQDIVYLPPFLLAPWLHSHFLLSRWVILPHFKSLATHSPLTLPRLLSPAPHGRYPLFLGKCSFHSWPGRPGGRQELFPVMLSQQPIPPLEKTKKGPNRLPLIPHHVPCPLEWADENQTKRG